MLRKNKLAMVLGVWAVFLAFGVFAEDKIEGQPNNLWLTPMGDSDIENTNYNRCRLIKTMKPGSNLVMQTTAATRAVLVRYASELYFQSVETNFEVDQEEPAEDKTSTAEVSLLNREIINRLARIANRLNIVVSLEARTAAMDNMDKLSKLGGNVFSEYKYDAEKGTCNQSNGG